MSEKKYIEKIESITDSDYFRIVSCILESEKFINVKQFNHHENRSVYSHSLMVSVISYKITKKLRLDYNSAAIGGLLHDFYYKDWQLNKEKKAFFKQHGFVHAKEALENSRANFPNLLNKKVENIILRHMFPLNIIPPRYIESWIITIVDKYVSFEIFKKPTKLLKYVGINFKSKRKEVSVNE